MSERYEKRFALTDSLYGEGAPVLIAAGVLLWDNKTGQALVQLKLRNIGRKVIRGANVTVFPLDDAGNPIGASVCHSYTEQNAAGNGDFGQKSAIVLPDAAAASFTARVDAVEFTDGSCWTGSAAWEALPAPQTPESLNDPELAKQFRLEFGENSRCLPVKVKDLRYCTCGAVNRGEEAVCCACGKALFSFGENDLAGLNEKKEARLAAEREEAEQRRLAEEAERKAAALREEQARQEAEALRQEKEQARRTRREKTGRVVKKTLLILLAAALVIGLSFVVVTKFVIPEVQRNQAYRQAEAWFDSGAYENAETAFLELGDYKDAPERALESRYQAARVCCDNGDYASAIAIWEELGGYSDSADRAQQALEAWREPDYQAAMQMMEQQDYIGASKLFASLDGYRDSGEKVQECVDLENEANYQMACAALANEDYTDALSAFQALGSYRDSQEQYVQTAYTYGCVLLEQGQYVNAMDYLKKSGGHADAEEKISEATYLYAQELFEEGSLLSAIAQYEKCINYLDSSDRILEAKLAYAEQHLDRDDENTVKFLEELVGVNYAGAQKAAGELYAWKAVVLGFNNTPYSTEGQETISKYSPMYAHFKVYGGKEGETTTVKATLRAPNGQSGSIPFYNCKDGDEYYMTFTYFNPSNSASGTLTLSVYSESGKLLDKASVPVVG